MERPYRFEKEKTMTPRRMVTGHDKHGKAIFLSDSQISPLTLSLMPGFETFEVWSENAGRSVPFDGQPPGVPRYFPLEDEVVFRLINFPPEPAGDTGIVFAEEAVKEMQDKVPGLLEHLETDHPGMHTTDSVDFGIVVKGEIILELDDGEERALKTGDCVIQNGTRHAWRNRSDEVVTMAFILLGARRIEGNG
jgi:mannose-6-phosphate isomerase-like protein (cupin superfamily)